MKNTPLYKEIQENMQPGVLVLTGFLGTDKRNLIDILTDDEAVVLRHGTTHKEIAEKLKYFRNEGMKGLGEFISVPGGFEVRSDSARGKLPCPFGDIGLHQKNITVVTNKKNNSTIVYSDLSIHMIEEHGFYQGKGCPYRLEPADLISVLELGKEE